MPDLSSLGAQSAGVWTRTAALAVLPPGAVRALLRDGSWQVVLPGVYVDGGCVLTPEQRAWAAVLACGAAPGQRPADWTAVAAGRTAARVWKLPLIDDDDRATGAREMDTDDVVVRRTAAARAITARTDDRRRVLRHRHRLAIQDVVRRPSGLLLTSPQRTLFDLAAILAPDALVCALDDALHRGLVLPEDLSRGADRGAWMPGAPAYRRAVSLAHGRAESPAETLTRLLLRQVLPGLEPQVEVRTSAGRLLAPLDLGDRRVRLAVEVDGRRGHAGPEMVAKDRRRDRVTEARGWWTERVTWWELRCRPVETRTRICARYAALAAQLPRAG